MSTRQRLLLVLLAFAALYVIWGSTYLAMKVAIAELPPLLMAGSRFVVAGGILLGCLAAFGRVRASDLLRPLHWRSAFLIGGGLMLFGNAFVALSLARVPTGVAALMVATTPMWLVGLDWLSGRSGRPAPQVILGIFVGLGGIGVLSGVLTPGAGLDVDPWGVLGLLLATLGWAVGSIYSRHAPLPKSILVATAMEMLAGGVLVLLLGACLEDWSGFMPANASWSAYAAWGYLIVFGSLIGFTAYLWLLREVSAAKVATYAYVNPIVAVWLGWGYLGEPVGVRTFVAAGLILAAVLLINLYRRPPKDAPATEPVASIDAPAAEEQVLEEEHHAAEVHASRGTEPTSVNPTTR